jgi:hypothetical protein
MDGRRPVRALTWRWLYSVGLVTVLFALLPGGVAASRHRPGPVTIRGSVSALWRGGFTLHSPSKGDFKVEVSSLTSFWIKTTRISLNAVKLGAHVGVRGYLNGHTLRAIRVALYPSRHVKPPKEETLRGTVIAVQAGSLDIEVSNHAVHVRVGSHTVVEERHHAVLLSLAQHGQRVDVRGYPSGHDIVATRVTLLVMHVKHPPTHTIRGTVIGVYRGGFILRTTSGQLLHVTYNGRVRTGAMVSVHAYAVGGRYHAQRVRELRALPVKTSLDRGKILAVGHGWIRVQAGRSTIVVVVESTTRITHGSQAAQMSALAHGQRVAVRYQREGTRRVATSIHIYAMRRATHPPTQELRGGIVHVHGDTVTIRIGSRVRAVRISRTTHVTYGSHRGSVRMLAAGQRISLRYYVQSKQLVATSIHIYAAAARIHTMTGVIIAIRGDQLTVEDRGHAHTVVLSRATRVWQNNHPVVRAGLRVGEQVRIHGTDDTRGFMQAARVDILPLPISRRQNNHLPTTVRGAIVTVTHMLVTLRTSVGNRVVVRLDGHTHVNVHGQSIPITWLFPGPTATVHVTPATKEPPLATLIEFHPKSHTLSGDVVASSNNALLVQDRSGARQQVLLQVARITDEGRRMTGVEVGAHVRVDGFILPNSKEAALIVIVTHPLIRVYGLVTAVSSRDVTIAERSGAHVILRFPKGVLAEAPRTGQKFLPHSIPIGSQLHATGVRHGGVIVVQTAILTLKSLLLRGSVTNLLAAGFILSAPGGTITIHVTSQTHITVGRTPAALATIMVGDEVTVRGYADATGGILAHSIDIHRRAITRTGDISNLQAQSFDLVGRDRSVIHVLVEPTTIVMEAGMTVPLSKLANGQHVTVNGHLRPDGALEATRITLK